MRRRLVGLLCFGAIIAGAAQADVFNLGAGFTNLETVTVGDPGNAGELSGAGAGGYGPDRICGSVDYTYNIGKYEVTTKQYTDFLNAKAKTDDYGLYNASMWSDSYYGCGIQQSGTWGSYTYNVASEWANNPVNYVSYWDACRFANWLGNGQGMGDTETGAYTLNGYNGYDGRDIQRNAEWQWAVTSEDEWYKAEYYKGGGTDAGYWDYPNTSDGGYLAEWNEAIPYIAGDYTYRGVRGFGSNNFFLRASDRNNYLYPRGECSYIGFRVSEVQHVTAVPEPSSTLAALSILGPMGIVFRRKGSELFVKK